MPVLHLALGAALIRIDCRHPSVLATLRAAWGPALELGARAAATDSLPVLSAMSYDENAVWIVDGHVRRSDPHYQDRVPQLEAYIIKELLPRQSQSLHVHAGCISFQRRAFLFCGVSGAGKSTMTRQAVRCGAHYLTDDCVVVDEGVARGLARCIQFDGLEPEEPVPPYLADCDLESYLAINERHVYRRIPLFRGPYETAPGLALADQSWVVVKLVRGGRDSLSARNDLERLTYLHESTVTTGRSYQDEFGFGPTFELTWSDPEKAFFLLQAELELEP